MDGKIWDPNSLGIDDFDALDYIEVVGDVTSFAGAMQLNIKRVRKAAEGEFDPADYLPVSGNSTDDMYRQLLKLIESIKIRILPRFFGSFLWRTVSSGRHLRDTLRRRQCITGLSEGFGAHLKRTRLCEYMAGAYPIINRDLLLSAALLHDVGKTRELSAFPMNDYTDEGQLLVYCHWLSDGARSGA